MQAFLITFISFWLPYTCLASGNWCYASKDPSCGPVHWVKNHPDCGKKKQSPIDIKTTDVQLLPSLTPFSFQGYDQIGKKMTEMNNTGHSVQLTLEESNTVSGGGLIHTYKALQLHFHWGKVNEKGSEHTIDGTRYPMEMHIVHQNTKYHTPEEALKYADGVVVLGFLFKESTKVNSNYKDIIDHLKDVKESGMHVNLPAFALKSLLPDKADLEEYYRYDGSLTTPGCQEAVIWTIFTNPIYLSKDQLNAFPETLFFNTEKEVTKPMIFIYRPRQDLNNRKVYKSKSKGVRPSTPAVLTIIFAIYLSTSFI